MGILGLYILLGAGLGPDMEWIGIVKYLGPHNSPSKFCCPTSRAGRRILTFSAYFRALLSLTSLSVSPSFQLLLRLSFGAKGLSEEFFLVFTSFFLFLLYTFLPEFLIGSSRMGRFKSLCFSA